MPDINNVVLVNPDVGAVDDHKVWRQTRNLPIRVGYTASILKNKVEKVSIIDMKLYSIPQFIEKIAAIRPDMIMIRAGLNVSSFSASTMPVTRKLIRAVKETNPGIIVVVAGPYPTIIKDNILNEKLVNKFADYILYGEEEIILPDLIDYLREGRNLGLFKGLSYRSNGQWKSNLESRFVENLDSLPWPAYDLMEVNKYLYHTVISGRGCQFNCSFCAVGEVAGGGQRLRSVKDVVNEMEFLYRTLGCKPISFYDENFFFSKERTIELCNKMLSRPVKFIWTVFQGGRVDKTDKEILMLMKKAGCFSIGFGLESADDVVLKNIDKRITVDDVKRTSKMMKDAGMRAKFFITVGNPGDTKESINKTIELVKEIVPDHLIPNMVVPYPNTRLKDWVERNAISLTDKIEDNFYTNDTFQVPQPTFETKDFSAKDRVKMFRKAASVSIGLSRLRPFLKRSLKYFLENSSFRFDLLKQLYYFIYFSSKRLLRL